MLGCSTAPDFQPVDVNPQLAQRATGYWDQVQRNRNKTNTVPRRFAPARTADPLLQKSVTPKIQHPIAPPPLPNAPLRNTVLKPMTALATAAPQLVLTTNNPRSVSLAWDASLSPAVTGYSIYRKTNSTAVYNLRSDVGLNLAATFTNLPSGTNYFVAHAYDASGLESEPSNEVFFKVPYQSNSVVQLVLEVYQTLGGPKIAETNWIFYTNSIPGTGGKFLRLREDFVRWDIKPFQ